MDDEVTDEEEVIAAVRALEAADGPLRSRDWPALADARLRQLVAHRLRGLGRQLLPVMDEAESAVAGYLSTWSDEAARDLARAPVRSSGGRPRAPDPDLPALGDPRAESSARACGR